MSCAERQSNALEAGEVLVVSDDGDNYIIFVEMEHEEGSIVGVDGRSCRSLLRNDFRWGIPIRKVAAFLPNFLKGKW